MISVYASIIAKRFANPDLPAFTRSTIPGKPGGYNRYKESEMKTHRSIAFLVALLLISSLAACKRPIPGNTTNPTSASESASILPTAGATDVLEQIYLFATQTAMATQGLTTGVPQASESTPEAAPETGLPSTPVNVQPPPPAVPTSEPLIAPSATPGIPASYTLHKGEFPYCIARRFNIDPGALLRANGLTSYSVYYAGMVLNIPQNASGFPGSRALRPHPATYTVRPGDTLYSIACAFGDADPNAIAYVNSLDQKGNVSPGDILQIP
jgi:LysM repeat protein